MSRCLGRLVRNVEGTWSLPFEGGAGAGSFHLPIRCDRVAGESSDLCPKCQEKEAKTVAAVAAMKGVSIGRATNPFLHGRVTEPVPFWSHIYDGAWFRLKLESGATVSEENMGRAKKAVEALGVPVVEPQPLPASASGATKKKKQAVLSFVAPAAPVAVAPPAAPVVPAAPAAPAPPPPSVAPAAPPAPKKRAPKKAASATAAAAATPATAPVPVAIIQPNTRPDPVEDVIRIQVIKKNIDGRDLYYDSSKGKVYDLKFRYLGRFDRAAGKVAAHPDSDAEC